MRKRIFDNATKHQGGGGTRRKERDGISVPQGSGKLIGSPNMIEKLCVQLRAKLEQQDCVQDDLDGAKSRRQKWLERVEVRS